MVHSSRRLAILLTFFLSVSPASQTQSQQLPLAPAFRTSVDIVSLNVTVTKGDQHYVKDLEEYDFNVFEDGTKQNIAFFTRKQLPVALALLLDTSASMEEKLNTAQQAAIGFAYQLQEEDLAAIIDFDNRIEILQKFTNQRTDLEQAIRRTSVGGSTSLYNAIYISLKELKKIQINSSDEIRRQAIIVLSDGEDTSSLVSFEEVLELAKRSETAIYTIGLRAKETRSSGNFRESDFVLRQLAHETGGRAIFPNRVEDLAEVYAQIAEELSSQYTIGYVSDNQRRDGNWRRVVVQVGRQNTLTRTKQGYYAPTTPK
jgi:Ca-activated chloride channel family protein